MTIYHEFGKRLKNSDRAAIIKRRWGTETPAVATKHTKVQVGGLTADEAAIWLAAKERNAANLWNLTFPAGARS